MKGWPFLASLMEMNMFQFYLDCQHQSGWRDQQWNRMESFCLSMNCKGPKSKHGPYGYCVAPSLGGHPHRSIWPYSWSAWLFTQNENDGFWKWDHYGHFWDRFPISSFCIRSWLFLLLRSLRSKSKYRRLWALLDSDQVPERCKVLISSVATIQAGLACTND